MGQVKVPTPRFRCQQRSPECSVQGRHEFPFCACHFSCCFPVLQQVKGKEHVHMWTVLVIMPITYAGSSLCSADKHSPTTKESCFWEITARHDEDIGKGRGRVGVEVWRLLCPSCSLVIRPLLSGNTWCLFRTVNLCAVVNDVCKSAQERENQSMGSPSVLASLGTNQEGE